MNKMAYLGDIQVANFCSWFARVLISKQPTCTQRMRGGRTVTFNGLPEALAKYDWPFSVKMPGTSIKFTGRTYAANELALNALADSLRESLSSGVDRCVRDSSVAVMQWGGVTARNVAWLTANTDGLHAHVVSHRVALGAGDDDLVNLETAITRFNAGMSKVYSLILDQFLIYDSRVAGALAWFVSEYSDREKIPVPLAFACLPAKEGRSAMRHKIRNPCNGKFPFVYNRPHVHAQWNLRASWILSESLRLSLLDAPTNPFVTCTNPMRALEAALFMWGYDLEGAAMHAEGELAAYQFNLPRR